MGSSFRNVSLANELLIKEATPRIVDLSGKGATAKIVRQGFEVPIVKFDPKLLDQAIGTLPTIPPQTVPRVLTQSIAPGTLVAKGAVVDVVMAPRTRIPIKLFTDFHMDLEAKSVGDLEPLFQDAVVKQTLLKYDSSVTATAAEKEILNSAFARAGITVDEANPGKTMEKAFQSARNALAFY